MQSVCVNNQSLSVKEYAGQRVVTFKDLDMVHQRPEGTARRNFKANSQRFIENEDYFLAIRGDIPMDEFRPLDIPPKGITLLTESGYLMLVKSFTDDLAWEVQRQLVKGYFRASGGGNDEEPVRMLYGRQVWTVEDIHKLTGLSQSTICMRIKRLYLNKDYCILKGEALKQFKEQQGMAPFISILTVVYASGLERVKGIAERPKAIQPTVVASAPMPEKQDSLLDLRGQVEACKLIADDVGISERERLSLYKNLCVRFGLPDELSRLLEKREKESFTDSMRRWAYDLLTEYDEEKLSVVEEKTLEVLQGKGAEKNAISYLKWYFNVLKRIEREIRAI